MERIYYKLEGKEPVPTDDIYEWAKVIESKDRIVEQTTINNEIRVSTVFLGLDHSFGGDKPMLFETMIFGGEHDGYRERYSTWDEAVQGHKDAIELVFTAKIN